MESISAAPATMCEIELRPAVGTDSAEISRLLEGARLPVEDLDALKLDSFIVALGSQAVIGVVGLETFGSDALLRSLAVKSGYRGSGLGARLLDSIEAQARMRGVTTLYLLTTTAAQFFSRAGYSSCDSRNVPPAIAGTSEFSSICPDSAACLRLEL